MVGMKNLAYNILVVSVISFAFFTFISALGHVFYAGTTTNTIVASVNVPSTCYLTINTASISFGSAGGAYVAPGTTSSFNSILYSDTAGNINAYLWVSGTNWIYSANSSFGFGVGNTLWSATSSGGTATTIATANTAILIPFASSNTAYYAVSIPGGQAANIYTANIIGQVSC